MSKPGISEIALRVVLAVAGVAIMATGVDVAAGGIATLGWQGGTDFFAVTDASEFAVHDSHIRFLGGLWLGVGLLFLASAVRYLPLKRAVQAALVLIFIGGLARLTAGRTDVLLGADVVKSFLAEVVLMPALLLWTFLAGRRSKEPRDIAS